MRVREVGELFPHTDSRALKYVLSMFFSFEEFLYLLYLPRPYISYIANISYVISPISIFNISYVYTVDISLNYPGYSPKASYAKTMMDAMLSDMIGTNRVIHC